MLEEFWWSEKSDFGVFEVVEGVFGFWRPIENYPFFFLALKSLKVKSGFFKIFHLL